jgi:hypothetical protein
LKEIYLCEYRIDYSDNTLNLAIAKCCPFLRKLSTEIKNNELETLNVIFDNCQYLEAIKIWCGDLFLNEKDVLESVVKYSKDIHEILLYYQGDVDYGIHPRKFESFFFKLDKSNSI